MGNEIIITELENDDIEIQMDSIVVTWSEINGNPENNKALIKLLTRLLAEKLDKKESIEAGQHTKITYDENGLVVAGEDLSLEDLPELHLENIVDVEATAEEVNKLHNLQATREEIDKLHDTTATTSEFNILHGLKASTEELNRLKGLLIASAQLNMLQGIKANVQEQLDGKMDNVDFQIEDQFNKTDNYDLDSVITYPSSKALKDGLDTKQDKLTEAQLDKLNKAVTIESLDDLVADKLDKNAPIQPGTACKVEYDENGLIVSKKDLIASDIPNLKLNKISDVNVSASELNQLKGLEADANDLNQLKGVENNVQLQFDTITQLLPDEATVDNKLADKQYVKNYVYYTAGFFLSKDAHNTPFKSMAELLSTHTFYDNGKIKRISEHDYTVVTSDETRNNSVSLYAWIRDEIYNEGHWVFQYKISNSYDDLTFDWGNIVGNITNQTDLMKEFKKRDTAFTTHKEDKDNPHKVTKKQVGLGNVDNTSDADKPISTDTQSALDEKQDIITDLETIREGATLGSTALQTEIDPVYTADKPNIALKSEIPTKVSSLTNDAKYQTASDVAGMIASIPQFEIKIVDTLPSQGQKMVLYLVPKTSASGDNIYDEYIWLENTSSFEIIGSTTVDLSDYYSKSQTDTLLKNKQDKLTEGTGITISNNKISNTFTSLDNYTTYSDEVLNLNHSFVYKSPTGGYKRGDFRNFIKNMISPTFAKKSDIPTKTSQLTNDSNYITSEFHDSTKQDKGDYALKSEIPTKVSSLDNDAKYQTEVDVASMIASIPQFELKIVDELPTTGKKMILYLVPKTSANGDDIHDEYIWLESTASFELVGSTTVDLSDYATKDELNLKVGNDEFVGIKDLTKTLTVKTKVSSFTTLGLNAIGSDSTYQATPINSGQSHWSSNAKSGLKIYIAFDKPTNANAINLTLKDTTVYGYPQINIYGGNSIADATTNLLFNEKAAADVNSCSLGDVEYQYFLIDLVHTNWINCMYAYITTQKDGIIRATDYQQIKKDITQHSNAIAGKEDKPTITKSNNKSGVIKHTDGRMEQWGLATSSTTGETEFTINANFIDTDFQVFIEPRQADNSVHYAIPSATNKFKARIQNTSGSDMACQFQWRAYGFWR